MFRRVFAFLAILIFSTPIWAQLKIQKSETTSTITVLEPEKLSKDFIVLDGLWDYYKLDFIQPTEFYPTPNKNDCALVTLPHYLEKDINYATYHCRVEGLLPNKHYGMSVYRRILSCSRIWCNNQLIGVSGFLNKEKHSSSPAQTSMIMDFPSDENGVLDIVIQVADFDLNKRGIVQKLTLTEKRNLENKYQRLILFSVFVISFLLMLIAYNLILIVMNRKPLLYFSLVVLCVFFILTIATCGLSILNLMFPQIPFWIEFRLPVFLLNVDICAYIFYMAMSRRIPTRYGMVLYGISAVFSVVVAFIPIKYFEAYQINFIIVPLVILASVLFLSLKFLLKKNSKTKNFLSLDALLYNFDMLINTGILISFILDFLVTPNRITLIYTSVPLKLGFFLFGFMQCAIPAFRRYFTNYRLKQSSQRFELNNNLLAKFVPDQLLKFLNAEDITKMTPGSCHMLDSMIVYTEIKYFKQLAESIGEKELFEVLTEYYKEIVPIIKSAGGYIAKYTAHGCIAIFIERTDAPIRCAMKMQQKMDELRRELRKKHKAELSIGIAIHTGKIACGVLGSEKHYDSITLSPEINVAMSIGQQTSKTNAKILISEDAITYCRTYTDCMYEGHFILVKGKSILVYSATPFKEFDNRFDDSLEPADENEAPKMEKMNVFEQI